MTVADDPAAAPAIAQALPAPRERIYRHKLATRITHWINLLALTVLLMTGLQIFNAHPRLYWGQYGANPDPAILSIETKHDAAGNLIGVTHVGNLAFNTTGVLGASSRDGHVVGQGFPPWITLPNLRDLATGRNYHFFFAWILVLNGIAYLAFSFASKHIQRDLALRAQELKPKHLLADIVAHAKLHVPRGEEAKRYNTLQKIAYLAVIFGLLPLMVLTGLTMSPGVTASVQPLLDFFGGRQSARSIHFVVAWSLVLFVAVHLFEIFLVGVVNEVRSMVTGWYEVRPEKKS